LLDFIDPSQHEIALRDLQAIAEGQSPPPVTYHLRRIRGGTTDVQIASVLTNLEGKPAMLSLVTDVSDCQQALRNLAESEERYRQLVENSPDGIAVTGNDGVVYANETLWRALGASSEGDVLGKPGLSFVHPDDQATFREIRRRVIRYGKPNPATPVRLVRLDGTIIETTAQTMFVHWGGEPATQTSLRDLATAAP
jgi:PAS domain S-box-containing protein